MSVTSLGSGVSGISPLEHLISTMEMHEVFWTPDPILVFWGFRGEFRGKIIPQSFILTREGDLVYVDIQGRTYLVTDFDKEEFYHMMIVDYEYDRLFRSLLRKDPYYKIDSYI